MFAYNKRICLLIMDVTTVRQQAFLLKGPVHQKKKRERERERVNKKMLFKT